jgi:phosphohistidine swiveling domain-containing protein
MIRSDCGTKAKTLKYLESRVSQFNVPELLIFDSAKYLTDPEKIVEKIRRVFTGHLVVVRSSASDEDGEKMALAGEYESVLNVPSDDANAVHSAISAVIGSYSRNGPRSEEDEIIVQEMVLNTSMSGVIFTHDLNTGAPYYVINYDDESGLTNTVTSGEGEYANRTLYIHRESFDSLRSERFLRLLAAVQELENIMKSEFLDIEFALGEDLTPYLFQVRGITTQPNWNRAVANRINAALDGIRSYVKSRLKPMTGIYGTTTVFGQMPDWNPAEMIGRAPRALAFSLYKTLITDHAWRVAREQMGYAVPIGQPLMVSLAGQPFIDTRLSFHSYLPSGLSPALSNKIVDAWVQRLKNHPELHDKIEFDVAITTYSFDIDEKMDELLGGVLTDSEKKEFKLLLAEQTVELISGFGEGSISAALKKVERLAERQSAYHKSLDDAGITVIYELISDCVSLGTVPFSILARHGFIARTILLSLERKGILSSQEISSIQSSVRTVASELVDDMHLLQSGKLDHSQFMSQYGHLRPGTYDILSNRYDQMPNFGAGDSPINDIQPHRPFIMNCHQKKGIEKLLEVEGFKGLNADNLLDYVQNAIVGREFGKFVFTRSVSDMLELIADFGELHGLSREEMSHIGLDDLLGVISQSIEDSIEERLRSISQEGQQRHELSAAIRLPQVLFDEAGVHVVPFQVSHPNFITHNKVTAGIVYLDVEELAAALSGKIILIENADPGFDWIFSQPIAGLITKYGGANSHMAIRCAEFGIPAAIGCGEQRFESLLDASQILLDCAAGLINPLH